MLLTASLRKIRTARQGEVRSTLVLFFIFGIPRILPFCSRHIEAQFFHRGLFRVKLSHYLAAVHDEYSVGHTHDLVKLQRYKQDGAALVS